MKSVKNPAVKSQLCRVGNYQMTGRLLGKGHFARVEEATHRLMGKTVAVKILDAACIMEEYARRHVKREPRVLARLRHPCIAMLYETMTCGSRLYLVLEACGGGDLCSLVLQQRDRVRGLAESRARRLAAHLVSAVQHMHACGVVHRDLKMENIMLDTTKQFIKIVDFGLSNTWEASGTLRTPCGSLEYAAPELFAEHRRYGPEVDMWSVGVIVFGMVTGGLPFTVPPAGGGGDRPLFSQIISKGITRKHSLALAHVSPECRDVIKKMLQADARVRLTAARAVEEPWLKPYAVHTSEASQPDPALGREIYRQISELTGMSIMEVATAHRSEPYGPVGGLYNIKSHQVMLQASRRDLRPFSALAEIPVPAPVHQQYPNKHIETPLRKASYSSRSLDPKCLQKSPLEKSVLKGMPCITESHEVLGKTRLGVKSAVRRMSPRLTKEQMGKYQVGSTSNSGKMRDFYQRAGDCVQSSVTNWRTESAQATLHTRADTIRGHTATKRSSVPKDMIASSCFPRLRRSDCQHSPPLQCSR